MGLGSRRAYDTMPLSDTAPGIWVPPGLCVLHTAARSPVVCGYSTYAGPADGTRTSSRDTNVTTLRNCNRHKFTGLLVCELSKLCT